MIRFRIFSSALIAATLLISNAEAAIFATGTFTGTVYRFEEIGGGSLQQSVFATIPGAQVLSGIVYRESSNEFFVGDIFGGAVHRINATGSVVQSYSTSGVSNFGPSSLAIGPDNRVYASGFGTTEGAVFALDENAAVFSTFFSFNNPLNQAAGGVGFVENDLLISTFGQGLFRIGQVNISPFASSENAVAQIAVDASNQIYVGSSDLSSLGVPVSASSVYKFDSMGNAVSTLTIDDSLLPPPPGGPFSSAFTNPSGVVVDNDGNLIVVAGGRTSPAADGPTAPLNGGVFVFDSQGNLTSSLTGIQSLSNVAFVPTAVPEPASMMLLLAAGTVGGLLRKRRRINA